VNWMAGKLTADAFGQGADQQGLAEPGHAFDQDVATRDQGNHDLFDHRFLANDDLAKLIL
jgi:hypothetical protein